MGKAGFAHLSDGDAKIQCYFRKDDLTETEWELYGLLDIGDHVGVTGELFRTKTGEKSIHVRSLVVLSKSLQTLPIGKVREVKDAEGNVVGTERWYELEDVDQRYRHRHLDLITNPEARQTLINRARITTAVRRYFDSQGYLEVETPTLQLEAGGAMARTFNTHYNAYEMDVKLRISLELYLKRLICGDLPKVYEIGRVYRNEGVSNRHSPEFTMCEFYEAYANLEDMMTRMEDLCRFVAEDVFGGETLWTSPAGTVALQASADGEVYALPNSSLPLEPTWGPVARCGRYLVQFQPLSTIEDGEQGHDISVSILDLPGKGRWIIESGLVHLVKQESEVAFLECKVAATIRDELGREFPLFPGRYRVFEQLSDRIRQQAAKSDQGVELDFSRPWRRLDLLTAIGEHTGLTQADFADIETALRRARELNVPDKAKEVGGFINLEKENNVGGLIEKLLEVFVEPTLQEPTFVIGYPIETSPLAKKDPNRPGFTRRFEGYILGRELCNAFSEINDPIDQRERFQQQVAERAKGDDEAHPLDEDFLYALECGMPPTGGCGFGIDRLAMLLTGADHIREVLFFPTMRPQT